MTCYEYMQWMELERIEPWGQHQLNKLAAYLWQTQVSGSDGKPLDIRKFLKVFEVPPKPKPKRLSKVGRIIGRIGNKLKKKMK